ncbi:ABC-2 transporter permease [Oscillospiraceae bacterium HV4-5-C5C]|nr:ABC-2 transporter permease [Oscillospiraceae bacterium HV4-5-C5C]
MRRLINFIRLDFATIRPYLTLKVGLLYFAVCLFVTLMTHNADTGISIALVLAMMMMSYPFATAEKSNLDALYATLALPRRTVVAGRYLFVLLLDLTAAVLGLLGVGLIGLFDQHTRQSLLVPEQGLVMILLFLIFALLQSLQLPVFFKLGYSKARLASLLPFVIVMLLISLLGGRAATALPRLNPLLQGLLARPALTALAALLLTALLWLLSAGFALTFYKKREF